jgi:phosphoglycerate dehydrogenase-like enzyme
MSERYRVLNLVRTGEPVYELMRREVPAPLELAVLGSGGREEVRSALAESDFAIAVRMDAEMIAAATRLRLLQLAGVGFDGVDLEAATRAGLPVAQTVEGTIVGVAEHAILLVLALYKRLLEADAAVRRGEWPVWELRPSSYTLQGKAVGIVGLGRIGREVALRVRAFGARVLYADALKADPEVERGLGATFVPLADLLSSADVVTLHVPLSPRTRGLLGERELRAMKPGAILVNTSRGEVVDEAALARALREGRIAGAGLDVLEREPPDPSNPLLGMRNVVLTPHVATGTRDSIVQKTRAACANFLRVLRGERPLEVVNPRVFERQAERVR